MNINLQTNQDVGWTWIVVSIVFVLRLFVLELEQMVSIFVEEQQPWNVFT
jgi:hypothetical protein